MRMWMINPKHMCNRHLLGEHGELHKFMHNWQKRHKIDGRIAGNAIEPMSYQERHESLAREMTARGFNHKSPLNQPDFSYLPLEQRLFAVDREASLKMLIERCEHCRERN